MESVQTTPTTIPTTGWFALPDQYEKWIDRARGEKFYRAILVNRENLRSRLSKRKFKRASDVLSWGVRFSKRCKA